MASQRDGGIAWCDETWNPIRGCSRVSEGCRHCYAERIAGRFSYEGQAFERVAFMALGGGKWNGRVELVESALDLPLRWKRPRRIFVNSMSDLFHEKVTSTQVAAIFGVMAAAKHHTFQILTKRPERMLEWFRLNRSRGFDGLSNVWLGVSVENQAAADERIRLLLQTPAAVRFLSVEPLLGPVDIWWWLRTHRCSACGAISEPGSQAFEFCEDETIAPHRLDWVIVGGESGPGARPCDIAWIRSIVAQCRAASVPVFVKQLGAQPFVTTDRYKESLPLHHRKGGDMTEWPEDLRVREFPR